MKLWLTASEIADLALPGLPATKRAVNALATREGWDTQTRFARTRAGRGGGLEYRIDLLPSDARLAYLARHGAGDKAFAEAGQQAIDASPDMGPTASRAATERDARLAVLGAFDAWLRAAGLPVHTGTAFFSDLYNAGDVGLPGWVRERIRRLSARTLARWRAARREGAVDRLAVDRGGARRGQGVLDAAEDGRLKAKALGLVAHQPHLTADHVRTILVDTFGDTVLHRGRRAPMPDVRTVQGALKRWKSEHRTELLAITNPDAFKSRARVTGSRAHLVTRLNELWEIDASPADVLTKDGRWSIYVCIDVYSRRIVATVTKTPRAEAVGLLLRKALAAFGVPERIKTDNGSDFTARATRRLIAALGIETDTARPFSPEEKGVVERAIRTMQHDLMPLLPGYVGHSVADRKVIEQRKAFAQRLGVDDARAFCVDLSAEELQARLDAWAADRYAHRPHGGLDGATPFAVAAAWRGPVRRIEDEAALAVLLAPVAGHDGRRTVGKQGIRVDGSHYIAPDLVPGESVFVRMDPADMGRAFVFGEDGESFRCVAVCPELAGIDPAAAVAEARAAQKRMIDERTAPIRAEARKIRPRDMADAVARQAARAAGKLVELPRPAVAHTTPALDAAALAHRGKRAPEPPPLKPEAAALMAKIEERLTRPAQRTAAVQPLRTRETPQQRFRRCLDLEAALERGETLAPDDLLWLGGYRESAEWRAMKRVHASFGDAALR
jgi:transposase InsO family protein